MNRHLVAAVSVGRDTKVPPAILAAGTDEAKNAGDPVGGIVFFQGVTIVGELWIQLGTGLLPGYLQRVIALCLAAQRGVRA